MHELERDVEITNAGGLHVRPISRIVEAASRFACEVVVIKEGQAVDAKSALELMLLAAANGTVLRLRCKGPDAPAAIETLARLFQDRFGEE
ncbi:MAG: HPr family phosphocarrier protein [Planctomycetes bacterium]|nr:HPr family phosphocarrier protein [Planctomycetota bacterium]